MNKPKQNKNQNIADLSDFDDEISLWQLIPPGSGRGLTHLKLIVDSYLNNTNLQRDSPRPRSILIIAPQGAKTYARSFCRALALEYKVVSAQRLNCIANLLNFFCPSDSSMAYVVTDIECMSLQFHVFIDQILERGEIALYNSRSGDPDYYPITGHIVMTAGCLHEVPPLLLRICDHVVRSEEFYTHSQLQLIIAQRLAYCNFDYENDEVLNEIIGNGKNHLFSIIRRLRVAITYALSKGRSCLTTEDVKRSESLMP